MILSPAEQFADQLLAEYMGSRSRDALDRLAEHHLPWITDFVESAARKMRLADPENATGECALLFVSKIVPGFNGKGSLVAYAKICFVRKLVDMLRRQRQRREIVGLPDNRSGGYWLDSIPAPQPQPPKGINWTQMSRGLTAMQETVLRLRYKNYLSVSEAADRLGMSCSGVKRVTRRAIDAARATWGDDEIPDELLAAENQN